MDRRKRPLSVVDEVQLVLCEHVVTLMGFDETADRIVTVLELVGGGDLFTALEKGVSR